MTFQSSRNAAKTQLDNAEKSGAYDTIELAKAHTALAQAEAFHELATALGNVAQGLGGLRR